MLKASNAKVLRRIAAIWLPNWKTAVLAFLIGLSLGFGWKMYVALTCTIPDGKYECP